MNFSVKDGQIEAAKTKKGVTSRNDFKNYQKKWNTESAKAPQPTWGTRIVNAGKAIVNKAKAAVTPAPKPSGRKGTNKSLFE